MAGIQVKFFSFILFFESEENMRFKVIVVVILEYGIRMYLFSSSFKPLGNNNKLINRN